MRNPPSNTQKQAFADTHNYALSCRGRMALGRDTTINGVVEVPDGAQLVDIGRMVIQGNWQGALSACGAPDTAAARVWLKQALPGHDLRAALGWQAESLDSAACYVTTPLSASVDLASKERNDGLQYQLGLHKVCCFFVMVCVYCCVLDLLCM